MQPALALPELYCPLPQLLQAVVRLPVYCPAPHEMQPELALPVLYFPLPQSEQAVFASLAVLPLGQMEHAARSDVALIVLPTHASQRYWGASGA